MKKVLCIDLDMQQNVINLGGVINDDIDISIATLFKLILDDKHLPNKKQYIWLSYGIDYILAQKN